jgi:hypothetical protein
VDFYASAVVSLENIIEEWAYVINPADENQIDDA